MSIAAPPRGLASLLSPLAGVVTALDERLLEPADALLHSCWCTVAGDDVAAGGAGDGPRQRAGGGWAPSAAAARAAAAGEAVERYSAALVPDGLPFATAAEMGAAALDPGRVRLFLDRQIAGTQYARLTAGTRVRWACGVRLPDAIPAWLPAQLAYLAGMPAPPEEPLLTVPTSNGLACGPTRHAAVLSALLELVERDAFALTWAARLSLPLLTWEGNALLETLVARRLAPTGLRFAAVDLSALLDVPVVLAVVTVPAGHAGPTAVGAAAAPTAVTAAARALAEGFAAFAAARALARSRADELPADGSGLASFADRVLFYADPARAPALAFLTASRERRHVEQVPALAPATGSDPESAVAALCGRLAARGAVAYAVDVTAPDVAAAGLHVIRAVCPELCQLDALHELRFLGVPRLLTGAWEAGLLARPLAVEEVNPDPHPFP